MAKIVREKAASPRATRKLARLQICGVARLFRRSLPFDGAAQATRPIGPHIGCKGFFALDEAVGHIIGDRIDHLVDIRAFGQSCAAMPRILNKPIGAPVVREFDEADHVNEQNGDAHPA